MAGSCSGCERVNFNEYRPAATEIGELLWGLLVLLGIAALLVAGVLILSRRYRSPAQRVIANALLLLLFSFAGLRLASRVRTEAFQQIAERGGPIVTAIREFEADRLVPPGELAELVPSYLSELPTTGHEGCPHYHYYADPEKNPNFFSVYAMCVGAFLKYNSDEVYGDQEYRVGSWAYQPISD